MTLKERLEIFAEKANIKITDNIKAKDAIIEILSNREQVYGFPICPCCFFVDEIEDILDAARCPCKESIKQIEETGTCHCGLFVKKIEF